MVGRLGMDASFGINLVILNAAEFYKRKFAQPIFVDKLYVIITINQVGSFFSPICRIKPIIIGIID